MSGYRFAVSVMPRNGILDPQGRAVEAAMPQLGATSVHGVRIGRRVEMTVDAASETEARALVERLAAEFLANPLVEVWRIERLAGADAPAAAHAPAAADAPTAAEAVR